MRADPPLIINVEMAAAILGVTRRQVYSMVAHHSIPDNVVVRVGRAVLFLRPRLLEWAGVARNGEKPQERGS